MQHGADPENEVSAERKRALQRQAENPSQRGPGVKNHMNAVQSRERKMQK